MPSGLPRPAVSVVAVHEHCAKRHGHLVMAGRLQQQGLCQVQRRVAEGASQRRLHRKQGFTCLVTAGSASRCWHVI